MLTNLFQLSDFTITKWCKIIFSNFISLEKCLHKKGLLLSPRRGPWWLILVPVFGRRSMKARHKCNQNEGPGLVDYQLVGGVSPYAQRKLILLCKCKWEGTYLKRKVVIIGQNNGNCDDLIPCVLWKKWWILFPKKNRKQNLSFSSVCNGSYWFTMSVQVFAGF